MILLLNTSTGVCELRIIDGTQQATKQWQAERQLARGLHEFIRSCLQERGKDGNDISAIGVFRGPGSFTGLRIGITVMNTLADSLSVPIVGTSGSDWGLEAQKRIEAGDNDRVVLPEYGSDANITKPRK